MQGISLENLKEFGNGYIEERNAEQNLVIINILLDALTGAYNEVAFSYLYHSLKVELNSFYSKVKFLSEEETKEIAEIFNAGMNSEVEKIREFYTELNNDLHIVEEQVVRKLK